MNASRTCLTRILPLSILLVGAVASPVDAGIALVKTIGTAGNQTTGTAISVAIPAAGVAIGNRIVVGFAMDPSAGVVSCSDSRGNAYNVDRSVTNGAGTSGVRTVICSAPVTTALVNGDVITVTHPSVAAKAVAAFEFSGVATAALDQTQGAVGNNDSPSSGATASTAVAEELLFGAVGVEVESTETFTPAVGYAVLPTASSGSSGGPTSHVSIDPEYQLVAVIGTYASGGTLERSREWATAIATYRAAGCGDGVLDPGEGCDDGNQHDGDCCSASCQIETSGTVCRAATDVGDVADVCNGASPSCPPDGFVAAGTSCRTAAGVCDVAETCSGSSAACPADAKSTAICRPAAGSCDIAEACDGVSNTCPADGFEPATHTCRSVLGVCDFAETCSGFSPTCPPDAVKAAGTACRAAAGVCDVAESCDGAAAACPANAFVADGTPCDDANACTTADVCTAGECVGDGTPTACADTMVCYGVESPSLAAGTVLNLVDQFEDVDVDVVKVRELCSPAEVDGVEAFDPITALTTYRVRTTVDGPAHSKRQRIAVVNEIGTISLDTITVDHLLVPSTHDSAVPAEVPDSATLRRDHYKCYKVRVSPDTPKFARTTLALADGFTTGTVLMLKKPKHLCTPVSVNGEPIGNAGASLLCYQARAAKGQPKHARRTDLGVSTDLGELVLSTTRERAVCVPSEIVP